MKTVPQPSHIPADAEVTATDRRRPVKQAPTRRQDDMQKPTVKEVTASWKMAPSLRIPQEQKPVLFVLLIAIAVFLVALLLTVTFGHSLLFAPAGQPGDQNDSTATTDPPIYVNGVPAEGSHPFADGKDGNVLLPFSEPIDVIDHTLLSSERAALIDVSAGTVIASYHADERMYPASMTKVMTLIVVAENLPEESNLQDTITVSQSVYDAMIAAGSSGVKLELGEQLSVEALIYMLMLQSDGIAANELARYIAGTESRFVELMNRKAADMGLVNTHFTNVTGLHDDNHYSTCRDIASIMAYAMNMSFCRKVMTTEYYKATSYCTAGENKGKTITYHVYHKLLVTMLSETYKSYRPDRLTVTAGKTGYDGKDSGYCLVSYAVTPDGKPYICVTSQSTSYLDCVKDYITIYNKYVK